MPAPTHKWKNPFYTLLIPAGLAFVLTVSAYVYMAFLEVNAGRNVVESQAMHPLFLWLKEHGLRAVLVELAVLAVLTVGAIATDSWWAEEQLPSDESLDNRGT